MKIRTATKTDTESISSLILTTAASQLRDEFSDHGWALFLQLLSLKVQHRLIKNHKFEYLVATVEASCFEKEKIVGVLAIKGQQHLFHFFILPEWQGKGIGKDLWLAFLQKIKPDPLNHQITVNSSDFGIPFYQQLGFVMTCGRQQKNGVCHTPMVFSLNE